VLFYALFVCLFVLLYVLFVFKCVLPPGDNPIAVNKFIKFISRYVNTILEGKIIIYIYIYICIYTHAQYSRTQLYILLDYIRLRV